MRQTGLELSLGSRTNICIGYSNWACLTIQLQGMPGMLKLIYCATPTDCDCSIATRLPASTWTRRARRRDARECDCARIRWICCSDLDQKRPPDSMANWHVTRPRRRRHCYSHRQS